jgi:hypothetical protein
MEPGADQAFADLLSERSFPAVDPRMTARVLVAPRSGQHKVGLGCTANAGGTGWPSERTIT